MTTPEAAAPPPSTVVGTDDAATDAPLCPLCKTPMVVRLSRRGPTAGSRYWGCPRDPDCLGRRPLVATPGDRPRLRRSAATRHARPLMTIRPGLGVPREIAWLAGGFAVVGMAIVLLGPLVVSPAAARVVGIGVAGVGLVIALAAIVAAGRRGPRPRGMEHDATSAALAPLLDQGWVLLEDRKMPASLEVIDHLLIGPGGVFTIASRSYAGRLSIRGHDLYLDGRRKSGIVELARRQAGAVVTALRGAGHADNAVAVLCVHRAQLPVVGSALDGVAIVDDKGLMRRIRSEPPKLNADRIAVLTAALEQALPAAARRPD